MRATKNRIHRAVLAVSAFGVITAITTAFADGQRYTATDPVWREECGSCHIPYPPALLPAASWRALMAQLDRHFGVDASVDAQTAQTITAFLEANTGGERRSGGAAALRITQTRWFVHEHDEVPARLWQGRAVKSAANCEACHARAAKGDFSERNLKVPR